jgi:hypothetical protein
MPQSEGGGGGYGCALRRELLEVHPQPLRQAFEHGCAAGDNNVVKKVPPHVHVALHDGVVRHLRNTCRAIRRRGRGHGGVTWRIEARQMWLEQRLGVSCCVREGGGGVPLCSGSAHCQRSRRCRRGGCTGRPAESGGGGRGDHVWRLSRALHVGFEVLGDLLNEGGGGKGGVESRSKLFPSCRARFRALRTTRRSSLRVRGGVKS